MADSDRPVLGLHIDGEIETKQIAVDASYWDQLRELQVFVYADAMELGSPTPLPSSRRPIRLRAVLASYACALFNLEAEEYPRTPRLKHWLENLAERTRRRVMDAVARLENAAHLSLKSLAYHNVKVTEMSETIDDALRALIEDQLRKSAAADSPSPPETIAAQIQRLRKESKWSVEKLAETVSLNLRTVTRHLSGSTIPHLGNISAYERVFAKRLKREVVISKMP